ncbi:MAG TPA: hypothetical protein VFR24_24090 [Candidatus Angelobacter sp.]|nr:hypothetical protein [Candidatus Angelobacter sp.]
MTVPKWWLALALVLALGTSHCAGFDRRHFRDAEVPKEVLSARTIAIIARVIGAPETPVAEYKARIEASALAEIQKRGRFQVVADPTKADLVCLMIEFSDEYWRESFSEIHGFMEWGRAIQWVNARPDAIIVMKGGNYAERDARPVWMKTNYHHFVYRKKNRESTPDWMMKDFLKAFEKAEKKNPSADEKETDEAELTDEAAADSSTPGGTDPANRRQVFCPAHQRCPIPRELYSARNVMICEIDKCNDKYMQKYVEWGKRWSLVDDPAQADLVLVICTTPSRGAVRGKVSYSSLYVFKGGRQPAWDSLLLYTEFDRDNEWTLKRFQKFIFEAH